MSRVKKWDVNWDAPAALVKFAALHEDEIAVAIQVINLIYTQNKKIKNEPENIAKYIKKMSAIRCAKVINSLVDKKVLYLDEAGYLSSTKCDEVLKDREESFNKYSTAGKLSAEAKAKKKSEEEQKQGDIFKDVGNGVGESITSISSTSSESKLQPPSSPAAKDGSFKILEVLSEDGLQLAKANAPGWDMPKLAAKFDAKIARGEFQKPGSPDDAFPAWCATYTGRKRPK